MVSDTPVRNVEAAPAYLVDQGYDRLASVHERNDLVAGSNNVPASFTRDVVSASNANRVVGNIGLPILARSRLLIGYPRDRLYALLLVDAGSSSFRKDRLGLSMTGSWSTTG